MSTIVRHDKSPMPEGCRWCGVMFKEHGQQWVKSKKWHEWEAPTDTQITARVRAHLIQRAKEMDK